MCKLILDRGNFSDFTSVSNIFIDEYMPSSNGEFVKIYLHLMRILNSSSGTVCELSTEKIADHFNLLESDIMRALTFWAKQKLITLSFDRKNQLNGIIMEPVVSKKIVSLKPTSVLSEASGESFSVTVPENTGMIIPPKKRYNAAQINQYANDERVSQLTFLAETYLGKTLTPTDINCILYMLKELNLDVDFIEYIMEQSISSGCKSMSKIEKSAVNYLTNNITTIEEAKQYEKIRLAIYKSIYRIFGMTPKAPVKKELTYLGKWLDEFGFSDEIIFEACNRTMEHTHTGSFQYTDKILSNWHSLNAHSMDEISRLDEAHSSEMKETFKPKTSPGRSKKKNTSFDQRTYDYEALEQKLMLKRSKKHSDNTSDD